MLKTQDEIIEEIAESLRLFIASELKVKSNDLLLRNCEIGTVFNPSKSNIESISACLFVENDGNSGSQLEIKPISRLNASLPKIETFNINNRLSRKGVTDVYKIICIIDFNNPPKNEKGKEYKGQIYIGDFFKEYILLKLEREEKDRWVKWIKGIIERR